MPEKNQNYELHRLLGTILSKQLNKDQKLDIMENEYDIPLEESIREDVSIMCNLSQGIKEEAFVAGENKKLKQMVIKMYEKGISLDQIAAIAEISLDRTKEIIENK